MTNEERADRAYDFIKAYGEKIGDWSDKEGLLHTLMADMIADMMHLCDSADIVWESNLTLAEMHYNDEHDEEYSDEV
jgi:hypothetical protein